MVDFNSLFDENGDIEDGGNQKVVDQQEDEGLAADEAEEDEVIFNEVSIWSICPIQGHPGQSVPTFNQYLNKF